MINDQQQNAPKEEPKIHDSPLKKTPKGGIIKLPDDYQHVEPDSIKLK